MKRRKILALKDKVEKWRAQSKKTLKSENIQEQTTRKLEHYEKMKAMHSRYRGRRRTATNILNKIMEKNPPKDVYQGTGRIENIK